MLLAVGVGTVISGLVGAHHEPAAAGPHAGSGPAGPTPAPLPRYYGEVEGNISHGSRFVVVRSVGTGAVVAQVPNPVDARHKQLSAIDVTTRDDQRFYVLYSERGSTGNGYFMVYAFTLSPAGTVTGPAEVPGGVITGQYYLALDGGFAVAPDGTELAIATADPAAKGVPQALAEQIVLIDTRTGTRATWKGGLDQTGSVFDIDSLSWTADSGALIYLAQWCPQGYSDQGSTGIGCITGFGSEQVRELSVSSGGGLLTSGPVLLRSSARIPYIGQALIDPDGAELTALVRLGGTSLQVVTIDVGTGKTQSVLYQLSRRRTVRQPDQPVPSDPGQHRQPRAAGRRPGPWPAFRRPPGKSPAEGLGRHSGQLVVRSAAAVPAGAAAVAFGARSGRAPDRRPERPIRSRARR